MLFIGTLLVTLKTVCTSTVETAFQNVHLQVLSPRRERQDPKVAKLYEQDDERKAFEDIVTEFVDGKYCLGFCIWVLAFGFQRVLSGLDLEAVECLANCLGFWVLG